MRKLIPLIGLGLLSIIGICLVIMIVKNNNEKGNLATGKEVITDYDEVVISYSSGYGVIADTTLKSIIIKNNTVELYSEEFDIRRSVPVTENQIKSIRQSVEDHLYEIKNVKTNEDALDGSTSYITVHGYMYGGYCVTTESFRTVVSDAFDIVEQYNEYDEFLKEIDRK